MVRPPPVIVGITVVVVAVLSKSPDAVFEFPAGAVSAAVRVTSIAVPTTPFAVGVIVNSTVSPAAGAEVVVYVKETAPLAPRVTDGALTPLVTILPETPPVTATAVVMTLPSATVMVRAFPSEPVIGTVHVLDAVITKLAVPVAALLTGGSLLGAVRVTTIGVPSTLFAVGVIVNMTSSPATGAVEVVYLKDTIPPSRLTNGALVGAPTGTILLESSPLTAIANVMP